MVYDDAMPKVKLSAVVNTKNAAETLDKCLTSLSFVDEIVVVDMHSLDKTKEIALAHQANFFLHDDVGYVEPARNFAIKQANHDYILILDADEEVSEDLKKIILKLLSSDQPADVYLLPRKNLMCGKWMQHTGWWPDYQPRLFRKGQVSWSELIHQPPSMQGKVLKLPANEKYALVHHHYPNIHSYLERLNRYTSIQAQNTLEGFSEPVTAELAISTFFNEFFRRFFVFTGYKDDLVGVALSFLQACYELTVQIKKWERVASSNQKSSEKEIAQTLEQVRSDLNYWLADWRVKRSSGFSKLYWQVRRKLKI